METQKRVPKGEMAIRVLAMPADTNPAGDIFGGWVLSQMDIAGGVISNRLSDGRSVTIAINSMTFHKPVLVGDTLCCYVDVIKTGNSSITLNIESWVRRQYDDDTRVLVTEGVFTYVAVNADRTPRNIKDPYLEK